jgi:phosphoglycerate dehydrogenase-like enzyme
LTNCWQVAEFLTVHVPLIDATRGLIGAAQIARMPKGALVLNFAREGIVDEAAAVASIDAGHLAGYVSDFPVNQTKNHPKCVTFPIWAHRRRKPRRTARSWSPTRFAPSSKTATSTIR